MSNPTPAPNTRYLTFTTAFETLHYCTAPYIVRIGYTDYKPLVCLIDSIELNAEAGSGSLQITLPADFERAALFVKDEVMVRVLMQTHDFTTSASRTLFKGVVKSGMYSDNSLTLSAYPSLSSPSAAVPPNVYSTYCQHNLYSSETPNKAGCGVLKEEHWFETTVGSVAGDQVVLLPAGGTLRGGALPISDALLTGAHLTVVGGGSRYVVSNDGWSCRLSGDTQWSAGQKVRVQLGCDKRIDGDCSTKFNNVIRFFGYTKIPGANPFTTALR
jgi:hypothetical protein